MCSRWCLDPPLYLLEPPYVVCALLFSNILGGGVRFFPNQNDHHWCGYQFFRSSCIFVMYFHFMGDYCQPSICCAVEHLIFHPHLLHRIHPLHRFWLVVASPSLSSVFHSWSLTIALIFPWWTLLPPFGHSSVEWYHRWLPQYLLADLLHFPHFHIPPALLPALNNSYGHRTPCWSVPLPLPKINLVQVGNSNLPRPATSLRFTWTCILLCATVKIYQTWFFTDPIVLLISQRGWSMPQRVLLCYTVHYGTS